MRLTNVAAIALFAALVLACSGCGSSGKRPEHRPPLTDAMTQIRVEPTGRIVLDCTPPEAKVNVDGLDHGTAAEVARKGGLTLPLGLHRVEITLDGYRPFRFELILGDKPEQLKVSLQPTKRPAP